MTTRSQLPSSTVWATPPICQVHRLAFSLPADSRFHHAAQYTHLDSSLSPLGASAITRRQGRLVPHPRHLVLFATPRILPHLRRPAAPSLYHIIPRLLYLVYLHFYSPIFASLHLPRTRRRVDKHNRPRAGRGSGADTSAVRRPVCRRMSRGYFRCERSCFVISLFFATTLLMFSCCLGHLD